MLILALVLSLLTAPPAMAQSAAKDAVHPETTAANQQLGRARKLMATAEYASAALALAHFARGFPAHDDAPDALADAAVLQLSLGLDDDAYQSINTFERHYGRARRAATGRLLLSYAVISVERDRHKQAKQVLVNWLRRYGGGAPVTHQIEANGLLGQTLDALGESAQADRAFQRVTMMAGKFDGLRLEPGATKEDMRALGRALQMVGQARYREAMTAYRRTLANKPPRFSGPATQTALQAHLRTHIRSWMAQRQREVSEAERAFLTVLTIRPEPPPQWVVKSAARVAELWLDSAQSVESAAPASLPPAVRTTFRRQLEIVATPLRMRAKSALRTCMNYGTRFMSEPEEVGHCEKLLSKIEPHATVVLEELIPSLRIDRAPPLPAAMADPRN